MCRKSKSITVLVVKPGQLAETAEIGPSLTTFQNLVVGYIEALAPGARSSATIRSSASSVRLAAGTSRGRRRRTRSTSRRSCARPRSSTTTAAPRPRSRTRATRACGGCLRPPAACQYPSQPQARSDYVRVHEAFAAHLVTRSDTTRSGVHTRLALLAGLRARAPAYPTMADLKDKGVRKGHVAVRLDPTTIARLDALLSLYALPGRAATRSDGLRAVILAGLEVEERRAARLRSGSGEGGAGSDPG
jgi:hypothetical protein